MIVGAIAIVCIAALAVGLYFGLRTTDGTGNEESYANAAVTTNGYPCAAIGR